MKLILVNLYSSDGMARYLLSSYVLKAYINKVFGPDSDLVIDVRNFSPETPVEEIANSILSLEPDGFGYSCYVWNIEKVVKIVKELKNKSDCIHIFGGPEITLSRILSLSTVCTANYYIIGEGERKLANLMQYLMLKKEDNRVPQGIAYWNNSEIIYDEDNGISGTIDLILANDRGELVLLDWKRSKEIKRTNRFQKAFDPISHLDDCNFNHYSLQLNFYRHIIETKYLRIVLAMFIVVFHPNLPECQFIHIAENRTDTIKIWEDFSKACKSQ